MFLQVTLFHRDVVFMLMELSARMRAEKPSWLSVTFVLPLDVEKLTLQLPPYVSACNYTV